MSARRIPQLAICALLIGLTLLVPAAHAAPASSAAGARAAQATDTPTPEPSATPNTLTVYTLPESGHEAWFDLRVSAGELYILLAVLAGIAFDGLRFLYELAHPRRP